MYRPPNAVFTPLENIYRFHQKIFVVATVEHLELLTAVLEKDPVVGMDWTKEPKMLQSPSATISWLASTDLPPAAGKH